MTARTHDAFAFAALVSVAVYYPPQTLNLYTLVGAVVGNIVGGTIPDLDQAGNRLWDLLPAGNTLGKVFRRIFFRHRTITHSILGVYLIYRILEFLIPKFTNPNFVDPNILIASIMIGYISHLFADGLTEDGLPLLFPFKWKFGFPPISSWRIKTGEWFEKYVVLPGVGLYLIFFVDYFRQKIVDILRLVSY